MWFEVLGDWLGQSAVVGTIVLAIGSLFLLASGEPVYRIRVIQWTLLACLLVPAIHQVELLPRYSLGFWKPKAVLAKVQNYSTSHDRDSLLKNLASDKRISDRYSIDAKLESSIRKSDGEKNVSSPHFDESIKSPAAFSFSSFFTMEAHKSAVVAFFRIAYMAFVLGILCVWTIGFYIRWTIVRMASPADRVLTNTLQSVAGADTRKVRLLVSNQLHAPIMWGVFSPTIVLPSKMSSTGSEISLRYGLAHEWSHIARSDFLVHRLASVVKLVCFYQPLYWWMRYQLGLCQDYLADAFAAKQGESAEDYAQFLVSIARQRSNLGLSGALCMAEGKSRLRRRVLMLIVKDTQFVQQTSRTSTLVTALLACSIILACCVVKLEAQQGDEPAVKKDEIEAKAAIASPKPLPDAVTYTGTVIDRETRKPIAGATVEVSRALNLDPKTGKWRDLETTKHESDQQGHYSFTLPPEQVAEDSLYLEVEAFHPNYQPKARTGYSHSMIRKNVKLGEPPFYHTIEMSSGIPITARVLTPNGDPAANVRVTALTSPPTTKEFLDEPSWAYQRSRTNENGELRFVVPTPGDGILWVFPKEFAPIAFRIRDKRGDLGEIALRPGMRLSGKVLSALGEPVPDVAVKVERKGDGKEADELLQALRWTNQIEAGAKTDANGSFRLHPLPQGEYRVKIESHVYDPTEEPLRERDRSILPHVFSPMTVQIEEGTPPEPLEIRAKPHVIVRGRFFNSKGKPRASHEQTLYTHNGESFGFYKSTTPGKDGWFEFRVPHGSQNAEINLTTNEHSALRWRLSPDAPFQIKDTIRLGTLEADFTFLEIVRYDASIVLLNAQDESGNQLKDFKPQSTYLRKKVSEQMSSYVDGGDVGFQKQPDGRWRSIQMVPDEEVRISAELEGYVTEPQIVSLKEGETRELVFVMKKKE